MSSQAIPSPPAQDLLKKNANFHFKRCILYTYAVQLHFAGNLNFTKQSPTHRCVREDVCGGEDQLEKDDSEDGDVDNKLPTTTTTT